MISASEKWLIDFFLEKRVGTNHGYSLSVHDASPHQIQVVGSSKGGLPMSKRTRSSRRSRAAVIVEYALLLTFVAVPTMMGVSLGGVRMLAEYRSSRALIMAPVP